MNLSLTPPRFCLTEVPFWVQPSAQRLLAFDKFEGFINPFLDTVLDIVKIRPLKEEILTTDKFADFGRVYDPNNATGLIGFFVRNECDLSLTYDTIRHDALDYVRYSSITGQLDVKIVSSLPTNRHANTFKLVEIFDTWVFNTFSLKMVWLCLALFTFVISLLLSSSRRSQFSFTNHFLNLIAILLLQGNRLTLDLVVHRLYWCLWMVSLFWISSCFSSTLLSTLASPDTLRYFDSLSDLLKSPKTVIRLAAETAIHYHFLNSDNEIKRKVLSQATRTKGLFDYVDLDPNQEFEELVAGHRVILMDQNTIYVAFDTFDKCGDVESPVHFSKDIVLSLTSGFVTRKNYTHPSAEKLRKAASNYFEGGIFAQDIRFKRLSVPSCVEKFLSPKSKEYTNLEFSHIYFPLIIWAVGILTSFFISFLEIYLHCEAYF